MANSFGNYNEPYINGSTLKRLYSSVVKDNIFQDLFTRDGEAVTEKYCEDTNVAQVSVLRVLPGNGNPRSIGAANNGGFFNHDPAYINETAAYGVDLLDMYDQNCDIPEVQQDLMSVDLAAQRAKIMGGQVSKGVNACTIAAQIAKNINDIANSKMSSNIINLAASPSDGDYLDAIIDASAKLDDGDVEEGVDTYPIEERAIIIKASFRKELQKNGNIIIGGSNYAQDIIKDGGLSHGDKSDNVTGFCGTILDMPVYMASKPVWDMAAAYLGLAPDALDDIYGLVVSGTGTLRGLAFNASVKQIDSPDGAGVRLQPKYRWGAKCILGSSVVIIAKNGFDTTDIRPSADLTLLAPASRTCTITFDANSGTGTVAGITKTYGVGVALPDSTGLTAPQSKTFKGWGTASTTEAASALAAGTVVKNYGQKYYAIWG